MVGKTTVIVALLCLPTFAAQTVQPAQSGSIQGIVTKAGTRDPLAGVQVILGLGYLPASKGGFQYTPIATSTRTTTTGENGRFSFIDLPPGQYTVRAAREGYLGSLTLAGLNADGSTIEATIGPQQLHTDVSLSLVAGSVVSGRVVSPNGASVGNLPVLAYRVNYQSGKSVLVSGISSKTDENGNYRLFWLPPGDYYIAADRSTGTPNPAADLTYYPKEKDARRAQSVRVAAGAEIGGMDIALQPPGKGSISGRVVRPTRGYGNYNFVLISQDERALMPGIERPVTNTALDRTNGEFELKGVLPGSYELYVREAGSVGIVLEGLGGRARIEVGDSDVSGVVVAMHPPVDLKGRIIVEGSSSALTITAPSFTTSVAGAPATVTLELSIELQPTDASTAVGRGYRATIDSSGAFRFWNVAPGTYRIQGLGPFPEIPGLPRDSYAADIRQGGVSVADAGISIDGDQTPGEIQVLLKTDGGTVEGIVEDRERKPEEKAFVILVPEPSHRPNSLLYKMGAADNSGHFVLSNVPPGQYKVFAWNGPLALQGAFRNGAFLEKVEEHGVPVIVGPSGKATVLVRPIPD